MIRLIDEHDVLFDAGRTCMTKGGQKGKIYVCSLDNTEVRQPGSSTGNLAKYSQNHHSQACDELVVDGSSHTNKRRATDGSVYETCSFKEAAPHHVQFVFMCAQDKRPPAMATNPGFRRFCSSLNKRHVPPSNRTSKRMGLCALSVMRKKKRLLFAKTRKEMGSKFASCSFDMVSNVIHILAC